MNTRTSPVSGASIDGVSRRRGRTVVAGTLCLLALAGELRAQQEGDAGADAPPPEKEEATLFPIPDYSGDLASRDALTGDWSGDRDTLAEHGLQVGVDMQLYHLGVLDGGLKEEWESNGTADYRIRFDSGKAGLWPGGFIELHGETYWGEAVNLYAGSVVPVNFDAQVNAPAGEGTYLTHWVVTQFLAERFGVVFGKLDTSHGDTNAYAHGTGDRRFLNAAFSLNPVTYLTSPYSTLGGGVVGLLGDEKQHMVTAMAYDGDGRINHSGFDTIDDGRTTYAVATRLKTNFFDQPGHQWFGYLYGDGGFAAQSSNPLSVLPDPPIDAVEEEDSTWTFFYNFNQQIAGEEDDPEQGWGVFGRFGIADEDSSVFHTFSSLGVGGIGVIPGRDRDTFGLGYYYMTFNDDRVEAILPDDEEHGGEIFYTYEVTPAVEITADLQVIDGGIARSDTAVVGGFRLRVSL